MKLYFAGPLFTTAERAWNAEVTAALRAAGHEVFLPQEQEPGKDAKGIFATDVAGIDAAEGSSRSWMALIRTPGRAGKSAYAYGTKKPIVLVRTDIRSMAGDAREYNPMLTQSAAVRLDLPAASTTEVVSAILETPGAVEAGLTQGAEPLAAAWDHMQEAGVRVRSRQQEDAGCHPDAGPRGCAGGILNRKASCARSWTSRSAPLCW